MLAAVLLAALALSERQRFESGVVQAYDCDAPWPAFRILAIVPSVVANLAMAAVAFVSASAGLFVATRLASEPLVAHGTSNVVLLTTPVLWGRPATATNPALSDAALPQH